MSHRTQPQVSAGERWRYTEKLRKLGPGGTDGGPSPSAGMAFTVEGEHERLKGLWWVRMADGRRELIYVAHIHEAATRIGESS